MKKKVKLYLFFLAACLAGLFVLFLAGPVYSQQMSNDSMIVEVNILGFGNISEGVGIEVSDYLFLGNLTKSDPLSDEVKVYVNNTGTVNITVTPELKNSNSIFQNLQFRTRQSSSNPDLNIFYKIGDYDLKIAKPSVGRDYKSEYCYMQLNLTDYEGSITEDMLNYRTELIFWAMPE